MKMPVRALVVAAIAVPLLLALPLPAPVAVVLTLGLLGVAPGLAMVRLLAPRDPVLATVATVVFSLSTTVAVSTLLLYLHLWSGPAVALGVGTVTAGVALVPGRRHELG
jgi:hypothetical protein